MNKVLKVIAIVAGCLLIVGVAFAGIGSLLGGQLFGYAFNFGSKNIYTSQDMVQDSVDIEPFDELFLESTSAYVIVKYGKENKVNYKVREDLVPVITQENGKLSVVSKDKDITNFDINMGFSENEYIEVVVNDDGLKNLDIISTSGGINIEDLSVEGKLLSTSGSVTIDNCKEGKDLSVQVSSGGMRFNNCVFEKLTAKSTSGELSFYSVDATSIDLTATSGELIVDAVKADDFKVSLTSGTMDIENIECKNLDTHNTSGSIAALGVKADNIKASGTSSDISFEIIGNEDDYDFNLKTTSGDVAVGDMKLDRKFEKEGSHDNAINANTTSGDIVISFVEGN